MSKSKDPSVNHFDESTIGETTPLSNDSSFGLNLDQPEVELELDRPESAASDSESDSEPNTEAEATSETGTEFDPHPQSSPPMVLENMPSRSDFQLGRRFFHLANGMVVATAYALFFTHERAIYTLGTVACLIYLFEQIRIAYPHLSQKMEWLSRLLLRAEEQVKESSMVPYVIATLLTILTFPKMIALIAIYTLAVADPLSALVGIRFGKHKIVSGKSLEGSSAFFVATFAICLGVLQGFNHPASLMQQMGFSFFVAFFGSVFEMLPIRIDDNLTIPISIGFIGWLASLLFAVLF